MTAGNVTKLPTIIFIAKDFLTVIFSRQKSLWAAVKFIESYGSELETDSFMSRKNTSTAKFETLILRPVLLSLFLGSLFPNSLILAPCMCNSLLSLVFLWVCRLARVLILAVNLRLSRLNVLRGLLHVELLWVRLSGTLFSWSLSWVTHLLFTCYIAELYFRNHLILSNFLD